MRAMPDEVANNLSPFHDSKAGHHELHKATAWEGFPGRGLDCAEPITARLLAQTEFLDEGAVAAYVGLLEVGQQSFALTDEH